jgi:hexokinase
MGAPSAWVLAVSSSSAKTAVARRGRGSAERAASVAACPIAAIARRTGGTASAATRSLSVLGSCAWKTQRQWRQRSFWVKLLTGRRLAISTP